MVETRILKKILRILIFSPNKLQSRDRNKIAKKEPPLVFGLLFKEAIGKCFSIQ